MPQLEGKLAHRELERTVLLLVERIGEHMAVIPLVALQTVGTVTIPEEVGVEGRHRSARQTQAHTVYVVVGEERVDRSQVEEAAAVVDDAVSFNTQTVFHRYLLALGMSHFHIVLHQGSHTEDDVFESLGVLHAVDKAVHRRFALREVHLPVFVPVSLIAVHRIHIVPDLRLALEELLRQGIEGIIGDSRVSHHQQVLKELVNVQFGYHIVFREHPLAVVELGVLLFNLHVSNPVYIAVVRHVEVTFLHVQAAVGKHIEFTSESEVLAVGWDKLQMVAQVSFHIHRIFDVVMVEADGCSADGRWEGILQQAHVIIVDVYIGEHLFQGGVENLSGLDYLSDSIALLTLDDVLFGLRIFAVNML